MADQCRNKQQNNRIISVFEQKKRQAKFVQNYAANNIFVQKVANQHNKMGKKKAVEASSSEKKATSSTEKPRLNTQKKRRFAKIYREYSRRKYNKYRLQFPKLRESDIVDKIIKEWEAFSEEQKMQLEKQFIEIGGDQFMKEGSKSKSSNSKSKSKSGSGSAGSQAKRQQVKREDDANKTQSKPKKKKPSPKVRVFIEKATDRNRNFMDDSDFKKDQEKQQASDNQSIEVVVDKKVPKKAKQIKKEKIKKESKKRDSQYLQFFKYYYNRLSAEHPRWSSGQITTIIRLLWKKRSLAPQRKLRKTLIDGSFKPVSGRVMYRRQKQANGLNLDQIKILWKLLPFECKKYWEKRGRGNIQLRQLPPGSLVNLKRTMKKGSEFSRFEESNNLRWLNSPISLR